MTKTRQLVGKELTERVTRMRQKRVDGEDHKNEETEKVKGDGRKNETDLAELVTKLRQKELGERVTKMKRQEELKEWVAKMKLS